MKILAVAVIEPTSTNWGQLKGFENAECEIIPYHFRERAKSIGYDKRDQEIIDLCKTEVPDLIWFSKANTIDIRVIKECNKYSSTFLYYMDPLDGNFNHELIEKIKYCEFTGVDKLNVLEVARQYSDCVYLIEEGYDHHVEHPKNVQQDIDVSFIGGLKEHRKKFHEEINFEVISNAFGENHSTYVSRSKINLNFTSNNGASDRVYKVLGAGGFLLTEDWYGRESYFKNDEHLVVFDGIEDLRTKINYYLKNDTVRNAIALSGYKEVQKYTRDAWATKVLNIYEKLQHS